MQKIAKCKNFRGITVHNLKLPSTENSVGLLYKEHELGTEASG